MTEAPKAPYNEIRDKSTSACKVHPLIEDKDFGGAHGTLIQILKPTPTDIYMLLCFIYRICIVIDSIERDIERTDVATQTKHEDILPIQIC